MIIGSFTSLYALSLRYPAMRAIPSLQPLVSAFDSVKTSTKGHGCGSCASARTDTSKYQPLFEQVMNSLNGEDLQKLKDLFSVKEIEYYYKNPATKLTEARKK